MWTLSSCFRGAFGTIIDFATALSVGVIWSNKLLDKVEGLWYSMVLSSEEKWPKS